MHTRSRSRRLMMEHLEDRCTPAVHTWIGTGPDTSWSNSVNWDASGVPTTGEAGGTIVVFHANSPSTQNIAGLVVDRIQFTGSGNNISLATSLGLSGSVLTDNLLNSAGANGIAAAATADQLVLQNADVTANVVTTSGNDQLNITAIIAGSAGLVKTGPGVLRFSGVYSNTYTGTTSVLNGQLSLDQNAGAVLIAGPLVIGGGGDAASVVEFNSGQIADTSPVTVNANGTFNLYGATDAIGPLTVNSGGNVALGTTGVLTVNGDLSVGGGAVAGGRVLLNGNIVGLASTTFTTIYSILDLNGATRTITVADGAAADDLTLAGTVQGGAFGITKDGSGTLVLAVPNTFTGTTTVNAGTLRVDADESNSPIHLTGGILGGGGKVGAITTSGGTITPGLATPPVALATGNLTLAGATYAPVLTSTSGGISDLLNVTGTVNLTGATLTPTLIGAGPSDNRIYLLIANDGTDPVVGTFNGLAEGATLTVGGKPFTISYHGNDGNDVTLTPVSSGGNGNGNGNGNSGGSGTGSLAGPVRPLMVSGTPNGAARLFSPDANGHYAATPSGTVGPFGAITADVRVASGDVDNDGVADFILVTGPGTPIRVAVVSGKDGSTLVAPFDPFGGNFTGGGFVATGDFDRDGRWDFVVTPDQGGGPRVSIFSLRPDGSLATRANFLGIDDPNFRGGARAAVGDVNHDGTSDLVIAAGFGGGPRVALFDGTTVFGTPSRIVGDFYAFPGTDAINLRNGTFVAAGDVDGDGYADLIFGGGPGGAPRVFILSGKTIVSGNIAGAQANPIANFFVANNSSDRGGVRVAVTNADGDAKADVAAGSGEGSPSRVRVYLGKNFTTGSEPTVFQDLDPFGATLADGVFVG